MLDDAVRIAFKRHITDGGLITAPEKLLTAVLSEVAGWLKANEQDYRKAGGVAEAKALRNLRTNLLKTS